jgi:histidine ammonia-lyase
MLRIDGQSLTLENIAAIAGGVREVALSDEARARIEVARAVVDRKVAGTEAVYGVNTGFGSFADVRIDAEALDQDRPEAGRLGAIQATLRNVLLPAD